MSEGSTFGSLKQLLVGRPIPSHLAHHERLSKVTGLAILSSVSRGSGTPRTRALVSSMPTRRAAE